ncbi:hypothetical protein Q31b_10560 [Novipirellula aureliae]|uniref:Uncharacterized protein n=2 Tax=Novipirellula aureliae TaxID=2527966 RepID=A0A5C6EAV1_9BACT|nr:hypothetical protein Q31b_10560 [Novipirellula aureliae]
MLCKAVHPTISGNQSAVGIGLSVSSFSISNRESGAEVLHLYAICDEAGFVAKTWKCGLRASAPSLWEMFPSWKTPRNCEWNTQPTGRRESAAPVFKQPRSFCRRLGREWQSLLCRDHAR